jgi:tellurite resistance protein
MFVIFGTKGVTSESENGFFFCPQCGPQAEYVKKRVRRHATLFFVPTVPMEKGKEYVECKRCQATFRPQVLHYDPETEAMAWQAEFHRAILKVMVLMMLADGDIERAEVDLLQRIYRKLAEIQLTADDILEVISEAQNHGLTIRECLKDFSYRLNDHGKEMVVRAAFMIATADGPFGAEERNLLHDIAGALEISSAHLNGIIQEMRPARQRLGQ